jgi:hypothetical protein
MGQFLRINGDYNIKTREGGTIILDTSPTIGNPGTVRIEGDLVVSGFTTAITSENLEVEDNIILLNKGEGGPGVIAGGGYSGISIDRGTTIDSSRVDYVSFLWNEGNVGFVTDDLADAGTWEIVTNSAGPGDTPIVGFADSNLRLRRILTDAGTDSGDLTLIGTGTGVVKVSGTLNYENQITDDDDLPNKKYVDDAILNNPTFQIRAPQLQDTRVIIADKEVSPNNTATPGSLAYFADQTGKSAGDESKIVVLIDNQISATFFTNRVELFDLEVNGNEITTKDGITNENILIRTQGTGKLATNYALELEYLGPIEPGSSPEIIGEYPGGHVIYSGPEGIGDSGVYFVSKDNNRDELISKNRALVFSMIF